MAIDYQNMIDQVSKILSKTRCNNTIKTNLPFPKRRKINVTLQISNLNLKKNFVFCIMYYSVTGSNSVIGLTRRRVSITEEGAVCKNNEITQIKSYNVAIGNISFV